MSEVADLPVLDVVSIEWPDEDTPCTSQYGCSRSAVWWYECSGCGHVEFACAPCKERNERWIERIHQSKRRVACRRCRKPIDGSPWIPLR